MISRPNFMLAAAVCTGLFVCCWLWLMPAPVYIWGQLDPIGYSAYRVRSAHRFTGPTESDQGQLEAPLGSWRVVARARAADSIFKSLASDTNTIAQLYGIAGIALSDPEAAMRLASRVAGDTTRLDVVFGPCSLAVSIDAQRLATLVASQSFAHQMLAGDSVCRVRARAGA